jgi:hypothetical protein
MQVRPRATLVHPVNIEELEEEEGMEQRYVKAQAIWKDAKEEEVFEEGVRTSTKVKMLTKVQPSAMEINMSVPSAIKREDVQPSWIEPHLWTKVFAFQILTDLCGYIQNKIMISMLRGWRIGRTSMKKKNGLLM